MENRPATTASVDEFGFRCTLTRKAEQRLRIRRFACENQWTTKFPTLEKTVTAAFSSTASDLCVTHGLHAPYRADMWLRYAQAVRGANGLPMTNDYSAMAAAGLKLDLETARQIMLDLPRTFPEQVDFAAALSMKGSGFDGSRSSAAVCAAAASENEAIGIPGAGDIHDAVGRMLRAFCVAHPATGYLQSMNFLAAFVLLVFGRSREAEAYYVFESVVLGHLRGYYQPDMASLHADCALITSLLRERQPRLVAHLDRLGLPDVGALFLPRWLLCIFLNCFPSDITVRVWDCVLADGVNAPRVLAEVSLAVIRMVSADLMACRGFADAVEVLKTVGLRIEDSAEMMHLSRHAECSLRSQDIFAWRRTIAGWTAPWDPTLAPAPVSAAASAVVAACSSFAPEASNLAESSLAASAVGPGLDMSSLSHVATPGHAVGAKAAGAGAGRGLSESMLGASALGVSAIGASFSSSATPAAAGHGAVAGQALSMSMLGAGSSSASAARGASSSLDVSALGGLDASTAVPGPSASTVKVILGSPRLLQLSALGSPAGHLAGAAGTARPALASPAGVASSSAAAALASPAARQVVLQVSGVGARSSPVALEGTLERVFTALPASPAVGAGAGALPSSPALRAGLTPGGPTAKILRSLKSPLRSPLALPTLSTAPGVIGAADGLFFSPLRSPTGRMAGGRTGRAGGVWSPGLRSPSGLGLASPVVPLPPGPGTAAAMAMTAGAGAADTPGSLSHKASVVGFAPSQAAVGASSSSAAPAAPSLSLSLDPAGLASALNTSVAAASTRKRRREASASETFGSMVGSAVGSAAAAFGASAAVRFASRGLTAAAGAAGAAAMAVATGGAGVQTAAASAAARIAQALVTTAPYPGAYNEYDYSLGGMPGASIAGAAGAGPVGSSTAAGTGPPGQAAGKRPGQVQGTSNDDDEEIDSESEGHAGYDSTSMDLIPGSHRRAGARAGAGAGVGDVPMAVMGAGMATGAGDENAVPLQSLAPPSSASHVAKRAKTGHGQADSGLAPDAGATVNPTGQGQGTARKPAPGQAVQLMMMSPPRPGSVRR